MARIFKWGLIGLATLVVVAAVLAFVAYRAISSAENSPLKMWIESQVRAIVQTYLNPRMEFQDLVYEYPLTVRVSKLRLSSPDPDNPGRTVDILSVDKMTIELADIPRTGQPIRIQKLILDHPSMQLVVPAGAGEGKLVGFSDFVKQSEAAKPQSAQPKEVRLSEVLQITLLQLIEGEVVYQTRQGGIQTLRLDGINSKMDIQKDQAGWYGLAASLERQGIFKLDAAGRLNLDDSTLGLASLALDVKLGREQDRYFPPQLQSLMRDHQITGALSLKISGTVPFSDPLQSKLSVAGSVRDAHFIAGAYRGQADSIDLAMDMAGARLNLTKLSARTLRGQADLTGTVDLLGDQQGALALNLSNIHIEDTLRAVETGGQPEYKGLLSAGIRLNCPLAKVLTEAGGEGSVQVREGRMSNAPVFAQVLDKLASVLTLNRAQANDEGDFTFTLAGDRVYFTKIDVRSAACAIHGDGDLYFNQNLDLTLTAGPMERIEPSLGKIGAIVGQVTSKAVREHVGGTVGNPAVTLQLLGGASDLLKLPH